jgi:hypothetical protein
MLVSHLAEHTHNIEADARVSFIVCGSGPDLQAQPRVTVLGDAHPTDEPVIARRYLRFYPEHQQYLDIGGFRFFVVLPAQVRLIQGFGGLHWIAGASYLDVPAGIGEAEDDILAHMNQDHQNALRDYCRHVHGVEAATPQMVGIDCDGFDVRAGNHLLRFAFQQPLASPGQVRSALVALAQQSRS